MQSILQFVLYQGIKNEMLIFVVISHTVDEDEADVLTEFKDVLLKKSDYNTATIQHHSVGIEMGGISVDVVPVIEDSNDDALYYIEVSETGTWTKTDPKGHKSWSTNVNKDNNNEYKPLVKIFKWWRYINCPKEGKYPKGITLEKIIADNLGHSSLSTEDFFIATM